MKNLASKREIVTIARMCRPGDWRYYWGASYGRCRLSSFLWERRDFPCAGSARPLPAAFLRCARSRGPCGRRDREWTRRRRPARPAPDDAEARRSEHMTAAAESRAGPRTVAVLPSTLMLAPMRTSSCTCMKRFSKMFSHTRLTPSACVARAMYCACMSVGKPGYSSVEMSAARSRVAARTRRHRGQAHRR